MDRQCIPFGEIARGYQPDENVTLHQMRYISDRVGEAIAEMERAQDERSMHALCHDHGRDLPHNQPLPKGGFEATIEFTMDDRVANLETRCDILSKDIRHDTRQREQLRSQLDEMLGELQSVKDKVAQWDEVYTLRHNEAVNEGKVASLKTIVARLLIKIDLWKDCPTSDSYSSAMRMAVREVHGMLKEANIDLDD